MLEEFLISGEDFFYVDFEKFPGSILRKKRTKSKVSPTSWPRPYKG